MIKTERQYQITKAQAEKFEAALREAEARSYPDPLLAQLERDALRSQFEELRNQLAEYDIDAFDILSEQIQCHLRRASAD